MADRLMEKESMAERSRRKRKKKKFSAAKLCVFAAVITAVLAAGFMAFGKYVQNNEYLAMMHASGFHFSSDLLYEDDETETTVDVPGNDTVTLQLCNYEVKNTSLVSDTDVTYKISVSDGWQLDSVTDSSGNALDIASDGTYTLEKDGENLVSHTLVFSCTDQKKGPVLSVKADSTAPYARHLHGSFKFASSAIPTWRTEEEDNGTTALVIESQGFEGKISLSWDTEKCVLVRTTHNPDVISWEVSSGSFEAERYSTYTIYFCSVSETALSENDFTVSYD